MAVSLAAHGATSITASVPPATVDTDVIGDHRPYSIDDEEGIGLPSSSCGSPVNVRSTTTSPRGDSRMYTARIRAQ